VTNDIQPGQEVLGSPAIPLADARRAMISLSRLPTLRAAVRTLTAELHALKRRLGEAVDEQGDRES